MKDRREQWITFGAGETVIAGPDAVHAFRNSSGKPARFLSISTQQHQAFLTNTRPRPEAMILRRFFLRVGIAETLAKYLRSALGVGARWRVQPKPRCL
jgi:hypothetical protein